MTKNQINDLAFNRPIVEDKRPFLLRLLTSIKFSIKPKLSKGSIIPEFKIKGGTDF